MHGEYRLSEAFTVSAAISRYLREGAMKTAISRFTIHDELTAPEGSLPSAARSARDGRPAAELPRRARGLTGRAARLRALRSELRHGISRPATLERIALAVAEHHGSEPGPRAARARRAPAGLRLDEIALAREWDSSDERERALLRYLQPPRRRSAAARAHLHEEAREAGWTDEQLLEAIAFVALEERSRRWSTSPARYLSTAPWRSRVTALEAPH